MRIYPVPVKFAKFAKFANFSTFDIFGTFWQMKRTTTVNAGR